MGSFITYRIQQAVPTKLKILHTCVQYSDEQFASQCGANLKTYKIVNTRVHN